VRRAAPRRVSCGGWLRFCAQLESRRKLDIQGLASDLASIKRQLRPLARA
jgi:hypothetical protein